MTSLIDNSRKYSTRGASNATSADASRSGRFQAWYEPGRDFCFYIAAQEACRDSRERLSKLKLSDDELSALSSGLGANLILENMKRIGEEQQRQAAGSGFGNSVRRFVNGFCDFFVQTSGVVQVMLPNSPEYTITYGLMFILFQAIVDKKKYQEGMIDFIEELKYKLPLIEFYEEVFPTNDVKTCVANLYVEILLFLEEAYVYCKSGRLSKLVDAILQPGDDRLADCTSRITAEATKLHALKEAGHIAEQRDIRELLSGTSQVVAQLYDNMNSFSAAIGSSLMILNQKCSIMESRSAVMFGVQANHYAQSLCDILIPDLAESDEELRHIQDLGHRLAPRDHWDNNGVLDDLVHWSQNGRKLPLWIGGSSGNQDSWVTEFSVDLVIALKPQSLTLLFAFCNSPGEEPLAQTTLIKKLIVQILMLHPGMRATTFYNLWRILEILLSLLSKEPTFIIIDRFEMCHPREDTAVQLLPALLNLTQQFSNVNVILTSVLNPPAEIVAHLYSLYIDTGRAARHRDR